MRPRTDMDKQSGFSLIEVMVALTVTLIILASVFSMLGTAMKANNTTYELVDAQEGLRTAQEYINRDLIGVGDGLRGINNIRVPTTFVSTWVTTNVVNPSGGLAPLAVLNSDGSVPAGTAVAGTNPVVNVLNGTDRISFLATDSTFSPALAIAANKFTLIPAQATIGVTAADVSRFNVREIYFIASSAGSTFVTITALTSNGANSSITLATGDTYGLNQTGAGKSLALVSGINADPATGAMPNPGTGTLPISLTRMRIVQYFINANNLLIRRVLGVGGGVGYTDSVIAEHATDLQFRYVLNQRDANGNLVLDANGHLPQPISQLTTALQQVAVEQVETVVTTATVHPVVNNRAQTVTQTARTSIRNIQFSGALQP